jgi:ribosomal protein S12 methylthiotransferase
MRRTIPGVTLRTSFIVGFPGETEKEFEELQAFVKESAFDWMGAFGYSDQEGAAAFTDAKKLSTREIESRRKSLMSAQKKISRAKKKALIGQEFDLLLEGASSETDLLLEGRTSMHAPEIDGKVFVNDYPANDDPENGNDEAITPREGEFYRCRITAAHDYDLVAEII